MQQPQVVPPQAQAMKPVLSSNVVSSADMNKLQEMLRMMGDDQLKSLVNRPYPVGTLAGLEVSTRNRAKLAAEARAAAGSNKNIIQQDIEQLALSKMRENIANDERMGLPNVVNQMEQNPAMMAPGGMVEGYNEGETVEERLRKFKESIKDVKPSTPIGRFGRSVVDTAGDIGEVIYDVYPFKENIKDIGGLFKDELSDADKKKLIEKGIDPDEYLKNPEAAIEKALPPAPGTAPGTASPFAGTEKRSPYDISPVRDKTSLSGELIRDKDGNLIADPDVSGFGGGDSSIRVIDTTDQTLADAKGRALAGLEAIRAGLPEVGTAKLGRLEEIEKADFLGSAKTYEEALRQRRQAAGLGELGAGQLTRAEEAAEKDKALARRQANLKLVEAGKAIQRGQKGGIQTIGDVLGGLAERKIAADAGERTAEKLLTAKRDAIELKREAEARGDVKAGLKFDKDIADSNLKIQQKNVDIANQEYALNKNAETQRAKLLADIGLKKSQIEVDFIKLDQMGKYRDMVGNAQLMMAQAKSGGATQKDLINLRKDLVQNIVKVAEAESDYGDPAKAKELRSKATSLLNMEIMGIFGISMPDIETIPDD